MSLYIRVQNSFWTHRKTIRLRAKLGDSALWIPPRLWSYAADNQPDGDFSDYTAEELAMLIGYSSNASSMLQALQEAGFMDEMRIHDWQEHNSYHEKYAERAKKAAKERWGKQKGTGQEKKGKDKKGKEASIPSSIPSSIKGKGTLQEIKDFCKEIELQDQDAEYLFYKWEGCSWTNSGKPIKDWKATIRAWKAASYLPSQKQAAQIKPVKPTEQSDVNPNNMRSL